MCAIRYPQLRCISSRHLPRSLPVQACHLFHVWRANCCDKDAMHNFAKNEGIDKSSLRHVIPLIAGLLKWIRNIKNKSFWQQKSCVKRRCSARDSVFLHKPIKNLVNRKSIKFNLRHFPAYSRRKEEAKKAFNRKFKI
jgi:hypothetical protein